MSRSPIYNVSRTMRRQPSVVLSWSGAWAIRQSSPARPACTIRTWTTCRCGSSSKLGRVELSLGELQRLAPGALVPLARPLDEPLDIMANGRRLGRGTLVQIGESLGVRIVSLAGNE